MLNDKANWRDKTATAIFFIMVAIKRPIFVTKWKVSWFLSYRSLKGKWCRFFHVCFWEILILFDYFWFWMLEPRLEPMKMCRHKFTVSECGLINWRKSSFWYYLLSDICLTLAKFSSTVHSSTSETISLDMIVFFCSDKK